MQVVENIALISINPTLFVQLVSFLIFLFIMNRLMFRPLRKVMAERTDYIQQIETEIVDAEKELDKVSGQIDERAAEVRQEAFATKEELEDAGSQEAAGIFDVVRKEIEAVKDKTRKEIDVQIAQAREHLQKESEALATSVMEKILERRLG